MTNVLSIIHFPVFGGPGNRNAMVAKHLAPHGINTYVVVPNERGNVVQQLRERGIAPIQMDLHRLRALKSPAVHAGYLKGLKPEIDALRHLIRTKEIDVVLINGTANPHGAFAAHLERVALVWQLLDTFPPQAFLQFMMPLVLRWSDVIMTNGMSVAAMHPGAMAFEGPLINFGPCVPVDAFAADARVAKEARMELGLRQDDTVIGTVNNINPMKGHFTFVRAAAALRRTHPSRFVILGAQHHDAYTRALIREAQRLGFSLGHDLIIRNPGVRVHEIAQAFDLFWLTSEPRSEGMSTSLAEAQALGIPSVVTRAGAVHECMRDGVTGYMIPPHDIESIARVSARILDDNNLKRRLSDAAARHARQSFSVEETALRHQEAYAAAVAARKRKDECGTTKADALRRVGFGRIF